MPAWFTDKGLNDNDSYMTDDIYGFLDDNSGVNTGRDKLRIAVGRIPVTSAADAKSCVDKLFAYTGKIQRGVWRNNVMIVADDKDNGVHMDDAEKMWRGMMANGSGGDMFYKKVYIDEFETPGNICEGGALVVLPESRRGGNVVELPGPCQSDIYDRRGACDLPGYQ